MNKDIKLVVKKGPVIQTWLQLLSPDWFSYIYKN